MLRRLSITVAVAGFILFAAVFGLVWDNPGHGPHLLWPMMAALFLMVVGLTGLAIHSSRAWRSGVSQIIDG